MHHHHKANNHHHSAHHLHNNHHRSSQHRSSNHHHHHPNKNSKQHINNSNNSSGNPLTDFSNYVTGKNNDDPADSSALNLDIPASYDNTEDQDYQQSVNEQNMIPIYIIGGIVAVYFTLAVVSKAR